MVDTAKGSNCDDSDNYPNFRCSIDMHKYIRKIEE
jgi:hypothetical protein